MKDPIKNGSKGSGGFSVKKVHRYSAPIIMESDKDNPRQAEKEDSAVEDEEGVERRFSFLPVDMIKPKNLGEDNKRYGTVTRVDKNGEKQRSRNQEPPLRCLQVFQKQIEARQPEKHK